MAYNTRLLPHSEWEKLVGTEAEPLIGEMDPNEVFVLVVEKDDKVIGSWLLVLKWHAECVWIHPDERHNPVVAGRLIQGMKKMALAVNTKNLLTSAVNPEIEHLITSHLKGVELPGKMFVFPV